MLIKATQKYTRQSPRKVRLVANQVKKLALPQALKQLAVIERRSTLVIMKVVKQAMANAINNHGLKFEDLTLDSILVTPGPTYRRMRAASRGRGMEIKKRSSHITVVLSTKEAGKEAGKEVIAETVKAETVKAEAKAKTEAKSETKEVKKTATATKTTETKKPVTKKATSTKKVTKKASK